MHYKLEKKTNVNRHIGHEFTCQCSKYALAADGADYEPVLICFFAAQIVHP